METKRQKRRIAKKILMSLSLALLGGGFAQAQNGLEGIVVEKYYIANAADAAASVGTLPVGSVTYRVYADMLPGYKFQALFGDNANGQPLKISTSTSFFNNEDRGAATANAIGSSFLKFNTVALDSWFSVGGSAAGQMGVLKTDDDGAANLLTLSSILNNTAAAMGTGLKTQDGNIAGSPEAVTFLGYDPAGGIFDAVSQAGNTFTLNDGAISALNGATGPTAANRVLLGQFTTDGVFRFELNIQIGTPGGQAQKFVAKNAGAGQTVIESLTLAPNNPPTVSVTSPANGAAIITGTATTLTASAADVDGTVTQVEFFVDGVSVGVDNAAPFTANYTAVVGNHNVTAVATDNKGDNTTSSIVAITVANNQAPTVTVAGSNGIVGDVITLTSTASDVDGSVAQVEFFVDNVSVGTDNTAPYSVNWTSTLGVHAIKAVATDNLGLAGTSTTPNITIAANNPPTATIASTSPSIAGSIIAPTVITINATATDSDGTVTGVEFLINGTVVGTDNTAPYSYDWTSTPGNKSLTVRSTDNKGAVTTSAAQTFSVADPNALPYEVVTVSQKCNLPTFNIAVAAAATNTVNDVIGYDMVVAYDKTKVTPTGNITVNPDLINPTFVQTSNAINSVAGTMNISVYFKANAPANTKFAGIGKIITVEFNKTANFASVDTAAISSSFLQESYIGGVSTKAVSAGKAITFKDFNFPMALRFWGDNTPIKFDASRPNDYLATSVFGADVTTGIQNGNNLEVKANIDGNMTYDLNNGLGIRIVRDIANTSDVFDVVNAGDVNIINSILLNDVAVTPTVYQMIAADVNIDGVISAGDISQIRQRGALSIGEFRQAWNYSNAGVSNGQPSKDWTFVDSLRIKNNAAYKISTTYPANDGAGGFSKSRVPVTPFFLPATVTDFAICPDIKPETYKGIMMGDVDGSYANFTHNGLVKNLDNKIVFDFANVTVNGTTIEVPVSIEGEKAVKGLDFAIKFNEDVLTYKNVVVNSNEIESFSHFNTNDRTLRFTSNDFSNFDKNSNVVSVQFDAAKGMINMEDLTSVKGMLDGKAVKVELRGLAAGVAALDASNSVKVYPNPAAGLLNIVAGVNSKVIITDISGKEVIFAGDLNANMQQAINVSNFANGMYLVKVYNENFNKVERVVINN
jgi:hypothetical protein